MKSSKPGLREIAKLSPVFMMLFVMVLVACSNSVPASEASDHEVTPRVRTRTARAATDSHGAAPSAASHAPAAADHGAAASSGGHDAPADSHDAPIDSHASVSDGHGASGSEPAKVSNGGAVHWAYDGNTGPDHWGDLADEFITCSTGTSQSPIDIFGTNQPQPASIEFNYHATPLSILNNGHTLQVNYAPGSYINIGDDQYELLQFHFHTPSEHQVDSRAFPMEGHLVHKDAHDQLAVVGVLIEEGHSNHFFEALVHDLPHNGGEVKAVSGVTVNANDLLPHDRSVYNYSGSLTTPPCSEGVNWNVMSTPIEMSPEQISAFHSVMNNNARPTQPLHGRLESNQSVGGHDAVADAHGGDSGHEKPEPSDGHGAAHWGYGADDGPIVWGKLSSEYAACSTGLEQSPIDVNSSFTSESPKSVFMDYGDTGVTIVNNGHTIQINYDSGSSTFMNGHEYNLLQFHFHTPSENTVNGSQYPMEMHLVHADEHGKLLVVGLLFEEGDENPLFAKFWDFLPRHNGEVPSDLRISITDIMPAETDFFTFDGSLTTPPCSEGVQWFMMEEPAEASRAQMDKFMSIFGPNARPTQPLNGRIIGQF